MLSLIHISVGIFLGPTVLGHYRPHIYETLFPTTGPMPIVLDTVTTLGVVFFLLTAGLEIDLRSIFRQGKSALLVSIFGVAFPFGAGFLAAEVFPQYMGAEAGANPLIFALFVGTALSISALPVIEMCIRDRHHPERARHAKTVQFELRRHHVVRYHPPTTCIAGCHRHYSFPSACSRSFVEQLTITRIPPRMNRRHAQRSPRGVLRGLRAARL